MYSLDYQHTSKFVFYLLLLLFINNLFNFLLKKNKIKILCLLPSIPYLSRNAQFLLLATAAEIYPFGSKSGILANIRPAVYLRPTGPNSILAQAFSPIGIHRRCGFNSFEGFKWKMHLLFEQFLPARRVGNTRDR
jgi:hypothetical protein